MTITCLRDCDDEMDITASEQTSTATYDRAGALITLESDTLGELEGDLIEVGFSTEATARIASKVARRSETGPAALS